jgi:transcriptional regulator with XRE-family HTH domain
MVDEKYAGPDRSKALLNPDRMGLALRDLRQKAGLTLDEAADRSGLNKTYLHNIETGKQWNPGIQKIAALCSAYKIPISKLAYEVENWRDC